MKSTTYILPTTRRPKLEEIIKWYYNAHLELKQGVSTGELKTFSKGKISQQDSSGSVSFLNDLNILTADIEKDKYRLTEFGIKFGTLIMKNASDLSALWEEALRKSKFVMDIFYEISTANYIERKDLIKVIVSKAGRDYQKPAARTGATAIIDIMETARLINQIKINKEHRINANTPKLQKPFVAIEKITNLQILVSDQFDLSKLIELCKEINYCYEKEYYFATGMLVRAVLDHVPPIFNQKAFNGVVSNYGDKSFKGSMETLDGYRDVFDGYLHSQISNKEVLAIEKQVDCSAHLDVLLGRIIKILGSDKS